MDTHFSPPERASEEQIQAEIEIVSNNPVMTGLLQTVSGLLAILNEQRQILSVNDSFLRMLGIEDPAKSLGLRLGETLQCIHGDGEPAGCGTTKYCSSCGAAVAMVASLTEDIPAERICTLAARRGDKTVDIVLQVRSHPIRINGKRFLLMFLKDITQHQQRAALERTFFHDINNMLHMLVGTSELLRDDSPSDHAKILHTTLVRLQKEVAIQRCLSSSEENSYQPMWHKTTVGQILDEMGAFFRTHPAAQDKNLDISRDHAEDSLQTDLSLLSRVLCNMITNALEATSEQGRVRIWVEPDSQAIAFCVWNAGQIPEESAYRIFQRNFSTKEQDGRGIGTFSMKLFGEKILGGKVAFTTSMEEGTVFRFTVPL